MTLKPIEDIYPLWPWVRDGLLRCAKKTGERYRPEDVYLLLQNKGAWLYVLEQEGERRGFLIMQRLMDPDGPVLFVFALWGVAIREYSGECYKLAEDLARSIGAKRIRMQSPRRGWLREKFFTVATTVFERELT